MTTTSPLTMVPSRMALRADRKSTRLNSSHLGISYAVFCLKKKKNNSNPVKHVISRPSYAIKKKINDALVPMITKANNDVVINKLHRNSDSAHKDTHVSIHN